MSVANWDQLSGTSTSFISKTTLPEGSAITEWRLLHFTASSGGVPSVEKWRRKVIPSRVFSDFPAFADLCWMVSSMAFPRFLRPCVKRQKNAAGNGILLLFQYNR